MARPDRSPSSAAGPSCLSFAFARAIVADPVYSLAPFQIVLPLGLLLVVDAIS